MGDALIATMRSYPKSVWTKRELDSRRRMRTPIARAEPRMTERRVSQVLRARWRICLRTSCNRFISVVRYQWSVAGRSEGGGLLLGGAVDFGEGQRAGELPGDVEVVGDE